MTSKSRNDEVNGQNWVQSITRDFSRQIMIFGYSVRQQCMVWVGTMGVSVFSLQWLQSKAVLALFCDFYRASLLILLPRKQTSPALYALTKTKTKSKMKQMEGWLDGSWGTGHWHQGWWPELDLQDLHGGRRGPTPSCCSLISAFIMGYVMLVHEHVHTCEHTNTTIQIHTHACTHT